MTPYAARTDAPEAGDCPPPTLVQVYDELAREAWGEADMIRRQDADMRRLNQGLPPSVTPAGGMMAAFAIRYRNMERIAKALEHARDVLLKNADAGRARARNAARGRE